MSRNNSAVAIMRLLHCEGFTEYTAQQIKSYFNKHCSLSQQKRYKRTIKLFSEFAKRLSEEDKFILGKYIGYLKRGAFETGLKIGLAAGLANKLGDNDYVDMETIQE